MGYEFSVDPKDLFHGWLKTTMKFLEANLPPELSTRSRMVYKQWIKVNGLAS